jgi:hypothetical protein
MAAIAFTGACICDSTIELLYRCEVVDAMAAHGDAKALEILKAIDFTLAPKISEYPKDDLPALLEKQEEDPRKMTSGDLSQWNDAMFKLFPAMRFLERVRKAANTIEERLAKMQSQQ